MRERKEYIDILRVLAAFGVITVHVSQKNWYGYIGSFDWRVFTVYTSIARVSVPIFFMISGCLLLNRKYTIKEIYKKIFKLVVFLISWSLIYKIVQLPNRNNMGGVLEAVKEIVSGDTPVHLWYIYSMIGIYIAIPLLVKMVDKCEKNELLYCVVVCFALGMSCKFTREFGKLNFLANNLKKLNSGYEIGYISYFILGYYVDKYDIAKKKRIILYVMGVTSLLITMELVIRDCIINQNFMERCWTYNSPLITIASCAWFVFIKNIAPKFKPKKRLLFRKITNKSLGIYAVHVLIILLVWKTGLTTFSFNSILSVPLISLLVFAGSYVVSFVIMKIPKIGRYLA